MEKIILIARKETHCHHYMCYSFRLAERVLLYAQSYRQDSTYNSMWYTSCGALVWKRNTSNGPKWRINQRSITPWADILPLSYISIHKCMKEMFYLTMHSTHFIYGYMVSDIWQRIFQIAREETCCCHHMGYSFWLTARVLLYEPSHRQDSTYHGLCYTSCGELAGMINARSQDINNSCFFFFFKTICCCWKYPFKASLRKPMDVFTMAEPQGRNSQNL